MNRITILLIIILIIACNKKSKPAKQTEIPKPKFRVTYEYTTEEINSFDSIKLRLKRNEIFAQYGYIFKSQELSDYFEQQQWYKPINSKVDSLLTDLDKKNIKLILEREKELRQIHNFDCKKIHTQLSKFAFNSSIQAVIDSVGQPKKSFVDKDEFCSVGQLHYWEKEDNELEIIILGNSYAKDVNLNAESKLYAIKTANKLKISSFGFCGIYLGEKSSVVDLKLSCLSKKFPGFEFYKSTGSSAVERFFIEQQKYVYILTNKKIWIHFSINSFDRVDYILIATLNARAGC